MTVRGAGLLTTARTADDPATFVRAHASVQREFGPPTQDSGNVSWLVATADRLLFVKTAGSTAEPPPGTPRPYFDHAGRVVLLRTAVELARSCAHPALPRLRNVVESPAGPILVYDAVPGQLVHVPSSERTDPGSAYRRFVDLPAPTLLRIFDVLIDLHRELAALGWVACDLYDGSLIVDFATGVVHVIDLDSYRRGPSRNEMGRIFGSASFMAPEEFELGAVIDQRTTVFTLGRLVWHFGTRLTERADAFCGSAALVAVVRRSIAPRRADRFPTVAAFAAAWEAGRLSAASRARDRRPTARGPARPVR